jgi:hypothetical protein
MAGVHSASALSSLGRDSQRACDNWRVLNAIASVAGGQWPGYIDEAAKAAQARVGEEVSSRLELLLEDIRAVGFHGNESEVIPSLHQSELMM